MLGADNNGVDAKRLSIIVIFNRYLRFAVRAEVFHLFAFASDLSKFLQQEYEPVR